MNKAIILTTAILSARLGAQASIFSFYTNLNGAEETPPNASFGWGTASVSYDSVTREFGLGGQIGALSSGVTTADIHVGLPGVSGPVEISIPDAPIGFTLGAINVGPVVLSAAQEADLFNGKWYVDIHTTDFPGGEIRGQLRLGGVVPEPAHYVVAIGAGLIAFGIWRRR